MNTPMALSKTTEPLHQHLEFTLREWPYVDESIGRDSKFLRYSFAFFIYFTCFVAPILCAIIAVVVTIGPDSLVTPYRIRAFAILSSWNCLEPLCVVMFVLISACD